MECFIDIKWAKLNNIPTHPLTNLILADNVVDTANETRFIIEIADLILCHNNHLKHIQFAITRLGKQSIILGYNWLHNYNPDIN
jgi:hypothetical protein